MPSVLGKGGRSNLPAPRGKARGARRIGKASGFFSEIDLRVEGGAGIGDWAREREGRRVEAGRCFMVSDVARSEWRENRRKNAFGTSGWKRSTKRKRGES